MDTILSLLAAWGAACVVAWAAPGVRPGGLRNTLVLAGAAAVLNVAVLRLLMMTAMSPTVLMFVSLGVVGVGINAALLLVAERVTERIALSGPGAALGAALGLNAVSLLLLAVHLS